MDELAGHLAWGIRVFCQSAAAKSNSATPVRKGLRRLGDANPCRSVRRGDAFHYLITPMR
jgi:hypothetical protein